MQPRAPKPASNFAFGMFFSLVFASIAVYTFVTSERIWATLFISVALAFAGLATLAPRLLAPLNKFWFGLGLTLGLVFQPLLLGLMYIAIITPVSVCTRLFGRDVLRIKPRTTSTYWLPRTTPSPTNESFRNQY